MINAWLQLMHCWLTTCKILASHFIFLQFLHELTEFHKIGNINANNLYKQSICRHQTPPRYRNAAIAIRLITAKRDVIRKTGSTWHIATPPEERRAIATGICTQKIHEDRSRGSRDMLADTKTDRQTDRQTGKLIAILRSLSGRSNNRKFS